jgi:hypothetical protein
MRLHQIGRAAGVLLLAGWAGAAFGWAQAKDIPKHGPAIVLFDGKDLSHFDTFIKSTGLNADPTHIFTVENGVIHVSGKEFGFIITNSNGARARLAPSSGSRAIAAFSMTSRARSRCGLGPSSSRSTRAAPATST